MPIRRIVGEGEKIPTGYGVAYFDLWQSRMICYPIPLNILIRSLRILLHWIVCVGYPAKWERKLLVAYALGRRSVWKKISEGSETSRGKKMQEKLGYFFVLNEEQKKLLSTALRETGFDDDIEALMEMARTYILIQTARSGQV